MLPSFLSSLILLIVTPRGRWATGALIFVADTSNWFRIVLGIWGGFEGLRTGGVWWQSLVSIVTCRWREWFSHRWTGTETTFFGAVVKLFPPLAKGRPDAEKLIQQGSSGFPRTWTPTTVLKAATSTVESPRVHAAWKAMWAAIVDDLRDDWLLTKDEHTSLIEGMDRLVQSYTHSNASQSPANAKMNVDTPIANPEALRRLNFFLRSLQKTDMPASEGALRCPSVTVLIPVYAEVITPELPDKKCGRPSAGKGSKRLADSEYELLKAVFKSEYEQMKDGIRTLPPALKEEAKRTWVANRYQCAARTIRGLMKGWWAFRLHLGAEIFDPTELADMTVEGPRTAEASANNLKLDRLTSSKFRVLAALQVYSQYTPEVMRDVWDLFCDIPGAMEGGLAVGYMEERPVEVDGRRIPKLFSCVIDHTKFQFQADQRENLKGRPSLDGRLPTFKRSNEPKARDWADQAKHKLEPTYQIELPIGKMAKHIYNGKADNQATNLPYTHSEIVQVIDMNQEGYMEEALKLPCALQEFRRAPLDGEPPSIVGFREHIFSNIGAMGDFAAAAELTFGTLVQRTMTNPLNVRMHYGHPDMLDKLTMIAQGGVSKGDKHVNLSEDIFAGMDATLRGRTITYCDYLQFGKGRDMGVDSVLGFFTKLASGTAKMTTSRQACRIAERMALPRNLSFYYGHIGSCTRTRNVIPALVVCVCLLL